MVYSIRDETSTTITRLKEVIDEEASLRMTRFYEHYLTGEGRNPLSEFGLRGRTST
jgi:hypothetical protein